jgi:hypothetical protein
VPFGRGFIRRSDAQNPAPPLTELMRGGRGGEVRLKLYLCLVLLAVKSPYDIEQAIPGRSWAEALDVTDPDRNGARRINDALDWLAEHKLIVSERRRGAPGALRLLADNGSGSPYSRPTPGEGYVRLPLGLWSNGWIVSLSGAALTILIILLDMQGGRSTPVWSSPTQSKLRYDLSPDTWTKGVRELRTLDLVSVVRRPQGDIFDFRRLRNAYRVHEDRFELRPGSHQSA